jgi:hypothetical protein
MSGHLGARKNTCDYNRGKYVMHGEGACRPNSLYEGPIYSMRF